MNNLSKLFITKDVEEAFVAGTLEVALVFRGVVLGPSAAVRDHLLERLEQQDPSEQRLGGHGLAALLGQAGRA